MQINRENGFYLYDCPTSNNESININWILNKQQKKNLNKLS